MPDDYLCVCVCVCVYCTTCTLLHAIGIYHVQIFNSLETPCGVLRIDANHEFMIPMGC